MVTITFLGTGDAFDAHRANSSYLIEHDGFSILFDCGFTTPGALLELLEKRGDPHEGLKDTPDAIVYSHGHGDHTAGTSRLLIPAWNAGRDKPLALYAALDPVDDEGRAYTSVRTSVETSWRAFYPNLIDTVFGSLSVSWNDLASVETIGPFSVSTALTEHPVHNLAVRFELGGFSFAISGDGALTDASRSLFKGVDVLIHEAFLPTDHIAGHSTAEEVIAYAREHEIGDVRLVHLEREARTRGEFHDIVARAREEGVNVCIADDNDAIEHQALREPRSRTKQRSSQRDRGALQTSPSPPRPRDRSHPSR